MKILLLYSILSLTNLSVIFAEKSSYNISSFENTSTSLLINRIKAICETPSPELYLIGQRLDTIKSTNIGITGYQNFAKAQGTYYLQDYQKSSLYFIAALPYFRSNNSFLELRTIYNQLGNINYILRNDKKAFEYYQLTFDLSKELNRKDWIANTYNNLGLVCHHQRDFKQAEFYYSNAVDIYKEIGDIKSIADVNYNRAMTYSLAKNNIMAEKYTLLSLSTYNQLQDIEGIANSTYFLGQISEDRLLFDQSEKYYRKSLELFESIKDSVNQMPCLMKLTYCAIRKHNYKVAEEHIRLFKHINSRIDDIEGDKEILKLEYLLNKSIGNNQLALKKLEELAIIKDSMVSLADTQKFAEIRASYAQDIQELELSQLKEKSKLNNIILLSLALSIVLILVVIYFIWRSHRLKEERKVLMLEHKVLRTRMDPHFVFNIMSALQYYILDDKPENAVDYINDFSALLRLILQYSKSELVPITTEKNILEHYFALQNRRFNNKISFSISIDEELLRKDVMIPPMLAQPFVENCLKHAGLDKTEGALILVSFKAFDKYIKLSIEDNGIGIEESLLKHHEATSHKSMAISITHDRLKLMNGDQKENVNLQINDLSRIGKRGTTVTFMIPISN